jgi:hypothetical protein
LDSLRLARLQRRREHLQERLSDTDDRLRRGAAVLKAQLALLERPDELYRRLNDHGRRLLNQAIFAELLVDQDRDDRTIQITGQTYTEPVRDLLAATGAPLPQTSPNGGRPAENDEPTGGTPMTSPAPVPLDGGSSKAVMVELRGFEPLTPSMPWPFGVQAREFKMIFNSAKLQIRRHSLSV